MKKKNYMTPLTEVINLSTEGMMAASILSGDGGGNTGIDVSDTEFDGEFQSRDKGGWSSENWND